VEINVFFAKRTSANDNAKDEDHSRG